MAEEEYDEQLNIEGGRQSTQKPKTRDSYRDKRCNPRLDELSKPRKWLILSTWRDYRYVFDPERMQMLKERIQEEFSMTPEETEVYFNQLRKRARRVLNKKALAKQIRREKAFAKESAYKIFKKLLRKAMKHAFLNPPPPIVSPMVRETSNKILELLCEAHSVDVPKRDANDKNSSFFLHLADWAAILLSNIYYEVSVNEKVETERFMKQSKTSMKSEEGEGEEEEEEEEGMENKAEAKSEPRPEAKSEPISEAKSEPISEAKSEPISDSPEREGIKSGDETTAEEDEFQIPE